MARVNDNFLKLPGNYLFAEIGKRVETYVTQNPDKQVIRLGIGDVTRPLPQPIVDAMHKAADEMGSLSGFQGYGPYEGFEFLRNKIVEFDYKSRGVNISADEVFVSDGAKSDTSSIIDIFHTDNVVAVCDPVYPVYVDSNVISGRSGNLGSDGKWSNIVYMNCTADNGFLPAIPTEKADLIYLCFPNNPTGMTATKEYLEQWVEYALKNNSVLLYDSAYEAFIQDDSIPHSIYEIDGARQCAIEFRSFSKTAGFTGTRCAYTIIPKDLKIENESANALWLRRQSTKFNGVAYVIQKAAEAVYSEAGQKAIKENIAYYMNNAKVIRSGLADAGYTVFGGENAPYIWTQTPNGMDSWAFFDKILKEASVVTTPGVGFGPCGQGYIRLTAFGDAEKTIEAVNRIKNM